MNNIAMRTIIMLYVLIVMAISGGKVNDLEFYPQYSVVKDVNYEADTVTVETSTGFMYQFYGCEDWEPGYICVMIMYNNLTPEITDDEIIRCQCGGYVD